ncbi:MAG: tRNA-splicing endonuclease [Methanocella sp. PtaU1.Bin125]|nr:MAG: tRNA-splicing endonuclease [Methanocella sp. PtaU1.Bin125]
MKGVLQGDRVIFGTDAIPELYETLYYGRVRGDKLELALVEAAYLLDREKISVTADGKPLGFRELFILASQAQELFELKYIVYRDLRERGYFVQPGVIDFRVFPRGGRPNVVPSRYFVHVISERKPLPLADIVGNLQAALNVRKEMVLAIVDEESDITYYGVKANVLKGQMAPPDVGPVPGSATLLEDRVVVWDRSLSEALHAQGFYGNPLDEQRLQLSLVESAYLIMRHKLEVADRSGAPVALDTFTERALAFEPDFKRKLLVYADLRDKGLVAKTGFKFGSSFRVYEHVESIAKIPHSRFLVDAHGFDYVFHLQALSRSVRLANSVRKEMVFACDKDGESTVRYFSLGRIKL